MFQIRNMLFIVSYHVGYQERKLGGYLEEMILSLKRKTTIYIAVFCHCLCSFKIKIWKFLNASREKSMPHLCPIINATGNKRSGPRTVLRSLVRIYSC